MSKELPSLDNGVYDPRIVGFVCNWGAYSALEAAGTEKIKYASNVRLLRLMCLGRVHTGLLLRAFEMGADGVLLLGCTEGNCHYGFGADRAKEAVTATKKILNLMGMGSKRVHVVEVPAGDGAFASRRINAFVKRTRELGPSPITHASTQMGLVQESASLF